MATPLYRILKPFDRNGDGCVRRRDFVRVLQDGGITDKVVALKPMFEVLYGEPEENIELSTLVDIAAMGGDVVRNCLTGRMIIPDFPEFRAECQRIFDECKLVTHGQVATYIPQLGKADPNLFAISVTTVNGQQFSLGDWKTEFCVQSCSKPVTYCMALKEHGIQFVHEHIGREPSGQRFNSMTLKEIPPADRAVPARTHVPHNPMINAGAIACGSLIDSKEMLSNRLANYLDVWSDLTGSKAAFDPSVFISERETADRNFALAYMLRESGVFPPDTDVTTALEFYFQQCSVTVNSEMMANVAATLANGGTSPITGQKVFEPHVTRSCLSLMLSCGMYDFSGEWAFQIGLPSKSAVSGAVMIVVPNVMGICVYSPALDAVGNSVRGIAFAQKLVSKFLLHHYDTLRNTGGKHEKINPVLGQHHRDEVELVFFLLAASEGDMQEIRRILARGIDINIADYDRRTALHVGASDGRVEVVKLLLAQGADPSLKDRWGRTALSDAELGGHHNVVELLKACLEGEDRTEITL